MKKEKPKAGCRILLFHKFLGKWENPSYNLLLLLRRIREWKTKDFFFKKYGDQIGILGDLFKKYGRQKVTYKNN